MLVTCRWRKVSSGNCRTGKVWEDPTSKYSIIDVDTLVGRLPPPPEEDEDDEEEDGGGGGGTAGGNGGGIDDGGNGGCIDDDEGRDGGRVVVFAGRGGGVTSSVGAAEEGSARATAPARTQPEVGEKGRKGVDKEGRGRVRDKKLESIVERVDKTRRGRFINDRIHMSCDGEYSVYVMSCNE